jgi:hypothetical protein
MKSVVYAALSAFALMASSASFASDTAQPSGTPSPPSPATSPPPPPTAPSGNTDQAAASQGEGENKIVCKKLPPPTGSRIGPRKICKTVADWRRQAQIADDVTTEIQKRKGYDGL